MSHVGEIIDREADFTSGERLGEAMNYDTGKVEKVVVAVRRRWVYEVRLQK